jgi:hypothetical protein
MRHRQNGLLARRGNADAKKIWQQQLTNRRAANKRYTVISVSAAQPGAPDALGDAPRNFFFGANNATTSFFSRRREATLEYNGRSLFSANEHSLAPTSI